MKRNVTIFLLIVLIFAMTGFAWANAGAPYQRPTDNKLVFSEDTGISLMEEWIHFNIKSNDYQRAEVEVIYKLKNVDNAEESITLLFLAPYLSLEDIQLTFNGEPIKVFMVTEASDIPEDWEAKITQQSVNIEPVNNRELAYDFSHWYDNGRWSTQGFQFDLPLALGEIGELELSYISDGGYYYYDQDVINRVYSQLYYLSPAVHWEGDTKVHLSMQFPNDRFAVYSNLPLETKGAGYFGATLNEIPKTEWVFNYVSKEGLFLRTNNRSHHNTVIAIMWIGILVAALFMRKKSKLLFVLLLLTLLPVTTLFKLAYGHIFMVAIFGPPIVGIGLIVLVVYWVKKRKKSVQ